MTLSPTFMIPARLDFDPADGRIRYVIADSTWLKQARVVVETHPNGTASHSLHHNTVEEELQKCP
jgi:hypothetical protein